MRNLIILSVTIVSLALGTPLLAQEVSLTPVEETAVGEAEEQPAPTAEQQRYGLDFTKKDIQATQAINVILAFFQQAGDYFSQASAKLWDGIRAIGGKAVGFNWRDQTKIAAAGIKKIAGGAADVLIGTGNIAAGTWQTALGWLTNILATVLVVVILLVFGFILMKLFQLSLVRNFFFTGLVGAVIIIAVFAGARYVVKSLFVNLTKSDIVAVSETTAPALEEDNNKIEQSSSIIARVVSGWKAVAAAVLHPLSLFGWQTAVDGGWSGWQVNGSCSQTCGGGITVKTRQCNNPLPAGSGRYCLGPERLLVNCNLQACPAAAPVSCQNGCASDCGPYPSAGSCLPDGACEQCAAACRSDNDCAAGIARCAYVNNGRGICIYNPLLPLISEFSAQPTTDGSQVTISWDIDSWAQSRTSHFELWRKAEGGAWQIVPQYKAIAAAERQITDEPPAPGRYAYGLHIIVKSQYTPYDAGWFAAYGYSRQDVAKLVAGGYTWNDLDRIKISGLSPEDERWLAGHGYTLTAEEIVNMAKSNYGTEQLAGFEPLEITAQPPGTVRINLDNYLNFSDAHYAIFNDGGAIANKADIVFGEGVGTITKQGGYRVGQNTLMGFGHLRYYNRGDSESEKITLLTNYVSVGTHPLWLMGAIDNGYGELGGGQQSYSSAVWQRYFKHLIEFNHPASSINFATNGYYQYDSGAPYADVYFPAREQYFRTDEQSSGGWRHGSRPFLEWQGQPYNLGGHYQSRNYGFAEAITWSGQDYLNYVNSYYNYLRSTGSDYLGTAGRNCSRSADFWQTTGVNTRTPLCPSPQLLAALDNAAADSYNVVRAVFYEDVPEDASRCPAANLKMAHPYQSGTNLTFDEQTRAGGYVKAGSVCVYEAYFLAGQDIIVRNWQQGAEGKVRQMALAVDVGNNALFEFMLNQPVKGSGDRIYVIEDLGNALYKRWIDSVEYNALGGRFIPVNDGALNNIPD